MDHIYTTCGVIVLIIIIAIVINWINILLKRRRNFKDQVAIVTGAGSGLGRCICLELARSKCNIVCVDLNSAGNEETVAKILKLTDNRVLAKAYTCDVSKPEEVRELAKNILSEFKHVDILVNNAGIIQVKHFEDFSEEFLKKIIDVNVLSHFWTIRNFLPSMLKRNKGHIVSISSSAGLMGLRGLVPYCTSKYALTGLMSAFRNEYRLRNKNIKTLSVHPGIMSGGMYLQRQSDNPIAKASILNVETAAKNIVNAIKEGKHILVMPFNMDLLYYCIQHFPAITWQWVLDTMGRRCVVFDDEDISEVTSI